MLKKLSVKNFAVIEDVSLEFPPGLVIFTGETGAGKSILIEALGFALGQRASSDFLRHGAARLEVSAEFSAAGLDKEIQKKHRLSGGNFTLRRELDAKGKSRAFIDGRPAGASELSELGAWLVDFHGQYEQQTLANPARQLELLDRFAGLEDFVSKTASAYAEVRETASRLETARMSESEKARLLDLYKYQLSEIDEAAVKPGEDAELETALPRAMNAEKLRALAQGAYEALYSGEGAAVERLGKALRFLDELSVTDPSLSETARSLSQALAASEETARVLSGYAESSDLDPRELDAMLSRQERLRTLKKKYGPELSDVAAFAESLRSKLIDLESSGEREAGLEKTLSAAESKLSALCDELHGLRSAAAKKLSALALKEIKPLGMPDARFSVSVEMDAAACGPSGADSVEFLFSPNPGQPLKPLKSAASGGELSRVLLGLKNILSAADRIGVLVFDEVDAGVGAVVGRLVGERLAKISALRQVLCVTHLAQVAGFGQAHFRVSKTVRSGQTYAAASKLDGDERVAEIAGMLGGKKEATGLGLKHARELLDECRVK